MSSVIVKRRISSPRNRSTDVTFKLDYLEHYFSVDRPDSMKYAQYFAHYYASDVFHIGIGRVTTWIRRRTPIEARITWYPPYAGEIFYLRMLLHHIAPRSWADLYGGSATFKQHCIRLGIVDTGEEFLYAMRDAIAGNQSPASCRHLFSLFISSQDSLSLEDLWVDDDIRQHLAIDFWPSEARGENNFMDSDTAEKLALMDIAVMVQGMGSMDFGYLMQSKDLPLPVPSAQMSAFHTATPVEHFSTFKRYASIVGYSVSTQRVAHVLEREVLRFRDVTKVLTREELDIDIQQLNSDQAAAFRQIMINFTNRNRPHASRLFNVNASAGCGKTFLMNRVLHAARHEGAIQQQGQSFYAPSIYWFGTKSVPSRKMSSFVLITCFGPS